MTALSPSRQKLAALTLALLVPAEALAQTPAAAPEPDWTFTGNVGLHSQYVFRGISQTNEKPAVHGGFDLSHKSGFYAGAWASNIRWLSNAGTGASASAECDFDGGFKGSLPADFGSDLGVLYYWYPGKYPSSYYATGAVSPNTTELYAALWWKFLTFRYSWSANSRTFGLADSRGSQYLDLTASYDIIDKISDTIGNVTVFGHLGKQYLKNNDSYDYGDWKIGASAEIHGVTVGLYGTGTNAQDALYTNSYGKNISGSPFVAYLQKSF